MNTDDSARSSLIVPRSSFLRRHAFALTFLAAIALTPFAIPLLRGEVFTLRDHFDYFQPLRWFTASELQAGRIPLWNPYSASGEPWLANPQTGVFYPPSWLFLILPFATAYMLFLLLHLVILGWGAYLLFARRASEGAALVGAAALMFSGPVLSLLDVSNNLATLAWLPLALWCAAEGAWRRGGFVLALSFLGVEPFFAAVGSLLYVVAGGGWRVAGMRGVCLAGITAFGISAFQLFPFLQFAARSDRAAGLEEWTVLRHSMSLRDWLRVAVPPSPFGNAVDLSLSQQFIPVLYASIVVCALALVGLATASTPLSAGRHSRPATFLWLTLLLACIALSLGPAFLAYLPVTLFRYPARLVPLAALAIAALAVAGWERIRPKRRWVDLLVVLIVVVDLLPRAWPLLNTEPFRADVVPYPRSVGATAKLLRVGVIDVGKRAAWISGYLNLYDRRFDVFTAAPLVFDDYARMHRLLLAEPTNAELARKGIGWLVTTHDLGLPPTARAENVTVYRNPLALPMAYLVTPAPQMMIPARAELDSMRARVVIDAPRDGVLVLLQQNAPGWRAFIDGAEARTIPVDRLFRGVPVTRGRHEVVWTYRPRSLLAGAVTTGLTLLAMTLSCFVKRAR